MKTNINQIFTIVGFFSSTIFATLAISWGMTNLISEKKNCVTAPVTDIQIGQIQKQIDLKNSIKLLIPKIK